MMNIFHSLYLHLLQIPFSIILEKNFDTKFLNESNFSNLTIDNIKKLGLSTNKAKQLKDLSNIYLSKSFVKLSELNNEELHKTLLSVFGIGPYQ